MLVISQDGRCCYEFHGYYANHNDINGKYQVFIIVQDGTSRVVYDTPDKEACNAFIEDLKDNALKGKNVDIRAHYDAEGKRKS